MKNDDDLFDFKLKDENDAWMRITQAEADQRNDIIQPGQLFTHDDGRRFTESERRWNYYMLRGRVTIQKTFIDTKTGARRAVDE